MEDETPTTPASPISPDRDAPSPTPVAARKRAGQPEKNSLFDILLRHRGTPLFIRPLCWADIHSTLLGAEFHELPRCDTPVPPTEPGSPPPERPRRPSARTNLLSRALAEMFPTAAQSIPSCNAVHTALLTLWPSVFARPQLLPLLHIFFGDRVYYDAVRMQGLWGCAPEDPMDGPSTPGSSTTQSASTSTSSSPDGPPAKPLICYIAKTQLAAIRRSLFRVPYGPNRGPNMPVLRLQQRRARALTPANADHDPYFAGVFLAMAQRHFYEAPAAGPLRRHACWTPQRPPPPVFHDLTLRILTHDSNTAEFIVFTGHVTAHFLEWFHDPWRCPGGGEPPGIRIEYARVPAWPMLGLRERLGKALGEDIVGPFDADQMEMWEDEKTWLMESAERKRKRAQGFNGSFDEESEVESNLGEKKKKRRLHGSNRVGVFV